MKTPNYVFDDELYHHGILGQRWGHRRFQNEDGSWTPEGRERYGEGDGSRQAAKPKVDARAKARASFEEKKYKMYMKSKEQRLKDKIAAKEERNRVREAAKTEKLARKEQAKIDKKMAVVKGTKLGKTKNMSDDDLQTAINRLKLEVEYNKNYAIASKPNSALARADRFFEGPTGQVVKAIAVATIPNVAQTIVSETMKSNLKYANKLDRDKAKADIEKKKSDVAKTDAEAKAKLEEARKTRLETENKIKLDNAEAAQKKLESDREFEQQKVRDENEYKLNKFDKQLEYKKASAQSHRDDLKTEGEQKRLNANNENEIEKSNREQDRLDARNKHDIEMDTIEKRGFIDEHNNTIKGSIQINADKAASERANEDDMRKHFASVAEDNRDLFKLGYFNAEQLSKAQSEISLNGNKLSSSVSFEKTIDNKDLSKPLSNISFSKDDFVSKDDISKFKSLHFSSGESISEIADKTGYSESTIKKYLYSR